MQSSVKRRWRQWRRLDSEEKRLFLSALLLLPIISGLLRAFLYRDVYQRLKGWVPLKTQSKEINAQAQGAKMAAIVELAARQRVAKTTCLRRSLVLWTLMRRAGIESDLRLGVRKAKGTFSGHAWVEIEGVVINDSVDVVRQYTIIDLENP